MQTLRNIFKKFTGITLPISPIPRRLPITTVVGAPIDVMKNQSPTDNEIDELHKKFIENLRKLFDDHKKELTGDDKIQLILESQTRDF